MKRSMNSNSLKSGCRASSFFDPYFSHFLKTPKKRASFLLILF